MRVYLTILILIFFIQSWAKADDISDFEIEGMSVGDSLLKFYSEKLILKKLKIDEDLYNYKKFYQVINSLNNALEKSLELLKDEKAFSKLAMNNN